MAFDLRQQLLRFGRVHAAHEVSVLDVAREERVVVVPGLDGVVWVAVEQRAEYVGVERGCGGPALPESGVQRVFE